MKKDSRLYLDDILESIKLISLYTKGVNFEQFQGDGLKQDAVMRRLEIIGEAVKRLPDDLKVRYADVPWKKIAGIRDVISHDYDGVSLEIVWLVVTADLAKLHGVCQVMLDELDKAASI